MTAKELAEIVHSTLQSANDFEAKLWKPTTDENDTVWAIKVFHEDRLFLITVEGPSGKLTPGTIIP